MKFNMTLLAEYFDLIASGKKQYEIRLYDDKRQQISLKDTIEFAKKNSQEKITCEVLEILFAPNFKTLLNFLPLQKTGFTSIEQALKECYSIYTIEQEKQFGVVAFKLKIKK